MKMKKEKIKIHTVDGVLEVDAETYGLFAVHKQYVGNVEVAGGITVTHIPSGAAVNTWVANKKIARFLVADLNRALQLGEIDNELIQSEDMHTASRAFPKYLISFIAASRSYRRGDKLDNFEHFRA